MTILTPMTIRIRPPTISTRFPHTDPIFRPNAIPTVVKQAATTPMTSAGNTIVEPIIASDKPTASASMLVAMESTTRDQPEVGSPDVRRSSFMAPHRTPDHVPADKSQQAKRDPMVEACDILLDCTAGGPADQRHEKLKQAEVKCQPEDVPFCKRLHGESRDDSDGEGVHRQCHCNCNQAEPFHPLSLRVPRARYADTGHTPPATKLPS